MDSVVVILLDLYFLVIELIWLALTRFLPATFYLTSIVIVPATTFGRVMVAYPKKADKPYRSWEISAQGRLVLSPALGNVFGFSFWVIVLVLVIITHRHT